MIFLYLIATLVGGVLLAASLFSGLHGGGHGGSELTADHGHATTSVALQFLSIRLWTYVLAFGGGTGLLLRLVAHEGEPLTGLVALGVGLVAGVFANVAIARAGASQDSGMVTPADLVGRTAGVVVPFGQGTTGKVRVRVRDADVDLLALTDDGRELAAAEQVLILEIRDGSAIVTQSIEAPHTRKA